MADACVQPDLIYVRSKTRRNLVLDGSEPDAKLRPNNGSLGQIWEPVPADKGNFILKNHLNQLVLGLSRRADVGCAVEVSALQRRKYQKWGFNSDGTIVNARKELTLEICDPTAEGAALKVAQRSELDDQKFTFVSLLNTGDKWWERVKK